MSLFFELKKAFEEIDGVDIDFHAQFQLLSRARNEDNEDNLAMRTADPLWMLGRQWQFGEFVGEDNGSPISVVGHFFKRRIEHCTQYPGKLSIPLLEKPLEVVVEAMHIRPTDLKSKVKIGQQFERLIKAAFPEGKAKQFIRRLRKLYPLRAQGKLDQRTERFLKRMQGKAIDGADLLKEIRSKGLAQKGLQELLPIGKNLLRWHENLFVQPDKLLNTWKAKQLTHQFKVQTKDAAVELVAPDYQSGHLDWYSFNRAKIAEVLSESFIRKHGQSTEALMPTNLSFPAMPEKRLFAFEDRRIDLGGMEMEDNDLIRIMLVDFSLFSGSDWYTIPLEMEMGELCWINQIEVVDVFGVKTVIQNGDGVGPSFADVDGDGRRTSLDTWDVFKIREKFTDQYQHPDHFLFLPPVLTHRQEAPAEEEVLLFRDEFANMVWAMEKQVRTPFGKTVSGFDQHLEINGPFQDSESVEAKHTRQYPAYRLATTVPSHWIPYLPQNTGKNGQVELRQAVMTSNEPNEPYRDVKPLSRLLKHHMPVLREEAVPKAGVRIQLTKQRIRWTDGKTYVWLGRKLQPGRGEGDSGLRFDGVGDQEIKE